MPSIRLGNSSAASVMRKHMLRRLLRPQHFLCQRNVQRAASTSAASNENATVGFIGIGHMGAKMAANVAATQGRTVYVYDTSEDAVKACCDQAAVLESNGDIVGTSSAAELVQQCSTVISMLPNDAALTAVTEASILPHMNTNGIHVSCSTVSPHTSRMLAEKHAEAGSAYVGAPVFARPDGIASKQASFVVSGPTEAVEHAALFLEPSASGIFRFGEDPGAGNVVKLCGNFMIASAIESIGETLALAENNGVDRNQVMDMLGSTIFDCLIYKGYGERVGQRIHMPDARFGLELGLKDVALVCDTAHKSGVPMPFASTLHDRLLAAQSRGRGELDWSAIGLSISEDAGYSVEPEDFSRTE